PSRIATGFQTGYFNEVSGMYVVRASDAHAWVEAWIEGRGWMAFDPTPSDGGSGGGLLARINMYLDATDSAWQQWVAEYDLGHQAALAAKFEGALRAWNSGALASNTNWQARMAAAAKAWGAYVIAFGLLAAFAV